MTDALPRQEVAVNCKQHGRMRRDEGARIWQCRGYAGETCLTAMIVTDAELARALMTGVSPPGTEVWYRSIDP